MAAQRGWTHPCRNGEALMTADSVGVQQHVDQSARSARDLLVVPYHFPPMQSAGVYRMVGLGKHLKERGWKITVLTVRQSTHESSDAESLALIPDGIAVVRTRSTEAGARLMRMAPKTTRPPASSS